MHRSLRWLAGLGPVLLLVYALAAPAARAAVVCRADPVVTLSNGVTLDLQISVQDTLSDVQHVAYTLHGPAGTTLVSVSYPDGTGSISSVQYVADNNTGNYDGDTVVTTGSHALKSELFRDRIGGDE